jgi:hypothetical protein
MVQRWCGSSSVFSLYANCKFVQTAVRLLLLLDGRLPLVVGYVENLNRYGC